MRHLAALFPAIFLAPLPFATAQTTTEPASQPAAQNQLSVANMSDSDLTALAHRLRTTNRLVDARSIVRILLGRNEQNMEARILDGEIALELVPPDVQAAKSAFDKVLRVQDTDFRANYGMGRIAYQQGSWRNAQYSLEKAAKSVPAEMVAPVFARLAQCYRKNGELPAAFKAVEKALAAGPQETEPHEVFIALLTQTGNFDRALSEADTLIELCKKEVPASPSKRDALMKLAAAYNIRLGVLQRLGQGHFLVGTDGNPTEKVIPGREKSAARLARQVAETYVLVADLNRALTLFTTLEFAQRAAQIDPSDVDSLLLVGMLQRNTSQLDEAIVTFRKVLEIDAGNQRARDELHALGASETPASQPTTATAAIP